MWFPFILIVNVLRTECQNSSYSLGFAIDHARGVSLVQQSIGNIDANKKGLCKVENHRRKERSGECGVSGF